MKGKPRPSPGKGTEASQGRPGPFRCTQRAQGAVPAGLGGPPGFAFVSRRSVGAAGSEAGPQRWGRGRAERGLRSGVETGLVWAGRAR